MVYLLHFKCHLLAQAQTFNPADHWASEIICWDEWLYPKHRFNKSMQMFQLLEQNLHQFLVVHNCMYEHSYCCGCFQVVFVLVTWMSVWCLEKGVILKIKSGFFASLYWEKLKARWSTMLQLLCTSFHPDTSTFQHERERICL